MRPMKLVRHAAAGVVMIASATVVNAQVIAQQTDNAGPGSCQVTNNAQVVAAAACAGALSGGVGSVSAAKDQAARTTSATATIQRGNSGGMNGFTLGQAYTQNFFTIAGSLPAQGSVIFHYAITENIHAPTGPAMNFQNDAAYEFLRLGTSWFGGSQFQEMQYADGSSSELYDPGAFEEADGVRFQLFGALHTGIFGLNTRTVAQASIDHSEPAGTLFSASITTFLRAMELTDAQGHIIATATFDATTGEALLDTGAPIVLNTTPEPATLSLMALGLAGVVVVRRRRRV